LPRLPAIASRSIGPEPFGSELKAEGLMAEGRRGGREGMVIPSTYKNIHGEIVKIDPKSLCPNTEVIRF
jgi:hypothetical protein